MRSADLLRVRCQPGGAREIAKRSRGTPRIANRLIRRIRDFAEVWSDGSIELDIVRRALTCLGVDEVGFDEMDRRLLETLVHKFDGGPVGVETLGASLGEEADTIELVYEPYLMQEGYLKRTPRGRVATPRTFELLGAALRGAGEGANGFGTGATGSGKVTIRGFNYCDFSVRGAEKRIPLGRYFFS